MRHKLYIILGLFVFLSGSNLFASELEVVEKDVAILSVDQATISQAPITEASAVVLRPEVTQEEAAPIAPAVSGNAASIVRATDQENAPIKKVMPMPAPIVSAASIGEPTRYTLGADDIIEIIVRRHSEFSGTYPINAEGKIQYKFVGDIEIKGLTKTEVKEKIAKILSKFIINPDVDVTINEYRSKIIYVIGEVGAPGKYYMKADMISLREAVVQAGLPTLSASMRKTQLIRPDKSGKPLEKRVDLYALLYEGKLNLDLDMQPGDVLVVPATIFAKVMRIINPVASPVMTSDSLRRVATGGI